ncbi:hypothetical protein STCU_12323 [Strigomonas culicis]|uniref:Uncharacterized protein n=1 Tax=Strigomonas culicis TaxID=28005 RepID=S9UKH9_9TRYP|nr:hypothetical protein STCU_12323 [Strigomonas culicis]|eukprot:EPY15141.1 hypothetical protein STCU_12323 [Strigomonas culicis]
MELVRDVARGEAADAHEHNGSSRAENSPAVAARPVRPVQLVEGHGAAARLVPALLGRRHRRAQDAVEHNALPHRVRGEAKADGGEQVPQQGGVRPQRRLLPRSVRASQVRRACAEHEAAAHHLRQMHAPQHYTEGEEGQRGHRIEAQAHAQLALAQRLGEGDGRERRGGGVRRWGRHHRLRRGRCVNNDTRHLCRIRIQVHIESVRLRHVQARRLLRGGVSVLLRLGAVAPLQLTQGLARVRVDADRQEEDGHRGNEDEEEEAHQMRRAQEKGGRVHHVTGKGGRQGGQPRDEIAYTLLRSEEFTKDHAIAPVCSLYVNVLAVCIRLYIQESGIKEKVTYV